MARLAAVLAPLAALPAAPTAPAPGLWEGTIGTLPVRACFAHRDRGAFGAYYYVSQLKLIPLEEVEEQPGSFAEGGASGPRWQVVRADGHALSGRWRDGRRTLPLELKRVPGGDGDAPCASEAFHAPRLEGLRPAAESASHDSIAYVKLSLDARPRFDASVETFELDGGSEAGRRINAVLREPLGDGGFGWRDCIRAALGHSPYEGSFHVALRPALISRRWLSVLFQEDVFCGGAHPSSGQVYRTFDRETGGEVDLRGWFDARAMKREGGAEIRTLTPDFRTFLLSGWRAEDPECEEIVRGEAFWNAGLTRRGFVFSPSLAHAVQACGIELTFSFAAMRPFLTDEGAGFVAEIEAEASAL